MDMAGGVEPRGLGRLHRHGGTYSVEGLHEVVEIRIRHLSGVKFVLRGVELLPTPHPRTAEAK